MAAQIVIDPPAPGKILLVLSDGEHVATFAIDRAQAAGTWDQLISDALKNLDAALAIERELARRRDALGE